MRYGNCGSRVVSVAGPTWFDPSSPVFGPSAAPNGQQEEQQEEAVRVAASTRRILFGFRFYFVLTVAVNGLRLVGVRFGGLELWIALAAVGLFVVWEQWTAVWIESMTNTVVVRRRQLWKLRAGGRVLRTYPAGTAARYDATAPWWRLWRVDRSLSVGGDRYAVLPESRQAAALLASRAGDRSSPLGSA